MDGAAAIDGTLQRTSVMSLHFAEKAWARAAHCGSSRRRWPYSFIVEPQPAALMTMVSTLACFEERNELAGHGGGLVFEAGVDHEGPAARLVGWNDDLEALRAEHACGGGVDVGERRLAGRNQ